MRRDYKYYDFVMALFVTVLLLSNLLSSAKLIDLGTSIGPLRLSFDAGTLVFPISYIFGDILTEVYGYRRSRRVIWTGFAASALMGFFVALAGGLPGEASWTQAGGDASYEFVLGFIPRLIVASLAAYLIGEFVNSYVIARMKVAMEGRQLWMRTIASTLAGQVFDTLIFFALATALGVFPQELFWSLVIANYILKVGIEIILTPITLVVVNGLKRAENEDVYDRDISFSPFSLEA